MTTTSIFSNPDYESPSTQPLYTTTNGHMLPLRQRIPAASHEFENTLSIGYVSKSLLEFLGKDFSAIPLINRFTYGQNLRLQKKLTDHFVRSPDEFVYSEKITDPTDGTTRRHIVYDDFIRPKKFFLLKTDADPQYAIAHVIKGQLHRFFLGDFAAETHLIKNKDQFFAASEYHPHGKFLGYNGLQSVPPNTLGLPEISACMHLLENNDLKSPNVTILKKILNSRVFYILKLIDPDLALFFHDHAMDYGLSSHPDFHYVDHEDEEIDSDFSLGAILFHPNNWPFNQRRLDPDSEIPDTGSLALFDYAKKVCNETSLTNALAYLANFPQDVFFEMLDNITRELPLADCIRHHGFECLKIRFQILRHIWSDDPQAKGHLNRDIEIWIEQNPALSLAAKMFFGKFQQITNSQPSKIEMLYDLTLSHLLFYSNHFKHNPINALYRRLSPEHQALIKPYKDIFDAEEQTLIERITDAPPAKKQRTE